VGKNKSIITFLVEKKSGEEFVADASPAKPTCECGRLKCGERKKERMLRRSDIFLPILCDHSTTKMSQNEGKKKIEEIILFKKKIKNFPLLLA
jgi:hypothetical protein